MHHSLQNPTKALYPFLNVFQIVYHVLQKPSRSEEFLNLIFYTFPELILL